MSDGHTQKKLASLGAEGAASPQGARRRALNEANKKARARFYAGEIDVDKLQKECTAACAGQSPDQWDSALDKYEAALAPYVKAADGLPPGARG